MHTDTSLDIELSDSGIPDFFGLYVLKNKKPVLADTLTAYARFHASGGNIVSQETIGPYFLSTVFLGRLLPAALDPVQWYFESMVFGGALGLFCRRYKTWDQAAAGHRQLAEWIRRAHMVIVPPACKRPRSPVPVTAAAALPGGPAPLPAGNRPLPGRAGILGGGVG